MSEPFEELDLPSNVIALRGVPAKARYGPPVLVLGFFGLGLGLLLVDFRLGTVIVALSVVLALVLRIVLPTRRAGLLVVRTRTIDVTVLSVLAGGLLLLALIVPAPPG
ncbi:MAG: DUF3017 domain-containing protein [Candidatus Nanopelagicales bacterium]